MIALTVHATVDMVLRHYFKPEVLSLGDELKMGMPKVLTNTKK
jgi:hypothetical protein